MSDIVNNPNHLPSTALGYGRKGDRNQFSAFPVGLVEKYLRWRRARLSQAALVRADDRTLKDIGVRRRDIQRGLPRADDSILEIERRRLFK